MKETGYFRPVDSTVLAQDWGRLTRYDYELKLRDGTWQRQRREAYDRGDGVVCLPYDPSAGTVLLVRQFRLPVHASNEEPFLIEAPAGLLDVSDPGAQMAKELEEETGYHVEEMELVFSLFMSPGSVTERLSFFTGRYDRERPHASGGGAEEEGEDIEVLHIPLPRALEMKAAGEIRDAKTVILLQHLAARGRKPGEAAS